MSNTERNLMKSFAGESQASQKYMAFALKAEQERYPQIAKLFRAASKSETIHAANHLRTLRGINSTLDNIKTAIEGETHEYTDMYPKFIETAKKEDKKAAEIVFQYALNTEEGHALYYKEALNFLEKNKDLPEKEYYVCSICGYTSEKEIPDKCPICRAVSQKFIKVD